MHTGFNYIINNSFCNIIFQFLNLYPKEVPKLGEYFQCILCSHFYNFFNWNSFNFGNIFCCNINIFWFISHLKTNKQKNQTKLQIPTDHMCFRFGTSWHNFSHIVACVPEKLHVSILIGLFSPLPIPGASSPFPASGTLPCSSQNFHLATSFIPCTYAYTTSLSCARNWPP